jgi:hypothetical protein
VRLILQRLGAQSGLENVSTDGIDSNINALGFTPVFALATGGAVNQFAGIVLQGPPVIYTVTANRDTGAGKGLRGYPESPVAARFQRAEGEKSPKNGTLETCRHTFPDSLSLGICATA